MSRAAILVGGCSALLLVALFPLSADVFFSLAIVLFALCTVPRLRPELLSVVCLLALIIPFLKSHVLRVVFFVVCICLSNIHMSRGGQVLITLLLLQPALWTIVNSDHPERPSGLTLTVFFWLVLLFETVYWNQNPGKVHRAAANEEKAAEKKTNVTI